MAQPVASRALVPYRDTLPREAPPLDEADLLALAESIDPALIKYVKRALHAGYTGYQALTDAVRRKASSTNDDAIAEVRRAGGGPRPSEGSFGKGFAASSGNDFMGPATAATLYNISSPVTGLISNLPAIMKNPAYHDYYLRHFGHELPIPYAATDGVANKTVGVRGSVSAAITVPAGMRFVLIPTPDSPFNTPYISAIVDGGGGSVIATLGQWYGGICPQALVGPQPDLSTGGNVDDRSLQFKGGLCEVSVSVGYNQSAVVGHIDPYATLHYGKALGLRQVGSTPVVDPDQAHSTQYRDYPYFSPPAGIAFPELMDQAVRKTLIGSSSQSGIVYRQVIRPSAHCFAAAIAPAFGITHDQLHALGYPPHVTIGSVIGNTSVFAQGMYLVDNYNGSSAVAVEITMQMAYRVRVDNQAPAIYMAADDETVPKHSIEFKPTTASAPTRQEAMLVSHSLHASRAPTNTPAPAIANTSHMRDSVRAITEHGEDAMSKIRGIIGKVPKVGENLSQALGGGAKVVNAENFGDVVGGLFEMGKGVGGAVKDIIGLF